MNGNDRVVVISGVIVLLLMLTTAMIFRGEASAETDISNDEVDLSWMSDLPLESGTDTGSQKLNEGSVAVFNIQGTGRAIKGIRATLTWEDEPDIRRARLYENQPDSFEVEVVSPDGNRSDSKAGANPIGGEGNINVQMILTDEEVDLYKEADNWTVRIIMTEAKPYEPRLGPGLVVLTDDGNDFDLKIEYDFYDLSQDGEE